MLTRFLKGTENNFNKYSPQTVDMVGLGFDYDSLMHYAGKSFSFNGLPTMVTYI
jgi:hypothetical protein